VEAWGHRIPELASLLQAERVHALRGGTWSAVKRELRWCAGPPALCPAIGCAPCANLWTCFIDTPHPIRVTGVRFTVAGVQNLRHLVTEGAATGHFNCYLRPLD
jgi:hypothetical protein